MEFLSKTIHLDMIPSCCAAITFAAVKYFLGRALVRSPSGPGVYCVRRYHPTAGNLVQRFLLNHWLEVTRGQAGESHLRFVQMAKEDAKDSKQKNVVFYMVGRPRLIIADGNDAHHILVERPHDFIKSDTVGFLHPLLGKHGLVTIIDEDYHTQQRSSVSHAFGSTVIRGIASTTMREHFANMIVSLRAAESTRSGVPQRLDIVFEGATVKVISEAAFHTREFAVVALGERQVSLAESASLFMILGYRFYNSLPTKRNLAAKRFRGALAPRLKEAIQNARKEPVSDDSARSLLQLLAQNEALTESEILDHAVTFLFAGHDTTATALMWCCYYVAKYPRVQEALFEELSTAFTTDTTLSVAQLSALPYLDAVLHEVLRIRPPVPRVARSNVRDHVLPSGTFVPAGTFVIVSNYALHYDEAVWGSDAKDFRPERWLDDPDLKDRVQGRSFLPFAAGKRSCIGREFAMYEFALGTALMIRNFNIAIAPGQTEPFAQLSVVTKPRKPIRFTVTIRA